MGNFSGRKGTTFRITMCIYIVGHCNNGMKPTPEDTLFARFDQNGEGIVLAVNCRLNCYKLGDGESCALQTSFLILESFFINSFYYES